MRADPRVVHVFSSAGLYGAEYAVLGLMPALEQAGIASTLACIDSPYLDVQPLYQRARTLGLPAQRIPCAGRLDRATTRALGQLLDQYSDAILHVHGYKSAFYALRARRSHPGVPIVSTLHGWVTNTRALWLYRMLELWMLRRMQRVCIVAAEMYQPLRDAGIPASRIRLIENGIDTTRFAITGNACTRSEFGIPADAFVFGAVQRLSGEKNPIGLLDAFAGIAKSTPNAWLVVAGDGPLRAEVEQRAHEYGIAERLCMLGARGDAERIYPLFDCFVLASLTEGLPLALLEAMACERPVIASAVGQIPCVLENLPSHVVPAGDPEALSQAMRQALHVRPPLVAMRQRVVTRYSVTRMAQEYAALYRELGGRHVSQAA